MMLNDQKYRQIVNEWFARLEKGYALEPYTKHELQLLESVIKRHNLKLTEKNIPAIEYKDSEDIDEVIDNSPLKLFVPFNRPLKEEDETESITQGQLDMLKAKLNDDDLKRRYSKYLTVFYYFSPNSLGEISEVLLAKLLGAKHTGGTQGLEDLNVDGASISLKTTLSGKPINLGSEKGLIPKKSTTNDLKSIVATEGENFKNMSINDIKKKYGNQYKQTMDDIDDRINSIASKLAGPSDNEYFVWVEKIVKKGVLTALNVHIKKFEKNRVINDLNSAKISVANTTWSIYNNDGTIVTASEAGKYLNINPLYVRSISTTDDVVGIDLVNLNTIATRAPKPSDTGEVLSDRLKTAAADTFFKMLDGIYDKFISSAQ